MTIKVYEIDRDGAKSYEMYTVEVDHEFTGVFVDGKTPITARAGRENDGFMLLYPTNGISGKKIFKPGDTLELANDLELVGA